MQKNWSQKDDSFEIAGFFQKSRVFCCYESTQESYASTHSSCITQHELTQASMYRHILLFQHITESNNLHESTHNTYVSTHASYTNRMSRYITCMCRHMLVIHNRMSRYIPLWVDAWCLSPQYIINQLAWVRHKPLWINTSCLSTQYIIDCFAWVRHKPLWIDTRCLRLGTYKTQFFKDKDKYFFVFWLEVNYQRIYKIHNQGAWRFLKSKLKERR